MKLRTRFLLLITICSLFIGCSPSFKSSSPPPSQEVTPSNPIEPTSEQPPASPTSPATEPPTEPAVQPSNPSNPPEYVEEADPLLDVDLLALHNYETSFLTTEQLRQRNESTIERLNNSTVYHDTSTRRKRISKIDTRTANSLIYSMDSHPVISYYASQKYDQPHTKIGYCFGRATYAHLALLKLGVAKESIRKAWLVGPMYASNTGWAFHVATIVRGPEGNWLVIDNYPGKLLELSEWVKYFYPQNKGYDNLRVYITSPQKFSVSLSKYDRVQLGLNVTSENDWYRHYFHDLMKWFSKNDLSQFGIQDLRALE